MNGFLIGTLWITGCATSTEGASTAKQAFSNEKVGESNKGPRDKNCPESREAKFPLPDVKEEHLSLAYWLARWDKSIGDPDDILLSEKDIQAHNLALKSPIKGTEMLLSKGQFDLLRHPSHESLKSMIEGRLGAVEEKIRKQTLVTEDGEPIAQKWADKLTTMGLNDIDFIWDNTVAIDFTSLRCVPFSFSLYKKNILKRNADIRFDRNLCSTIWPQEPLQIIAQWPNSEMYLVRTPYALGWIDQNALLSPKLQQLDFARFISGEKIKLKRETLSNLFSDKHTYVDKSTWLPFSSAEKPEVLMAFSEGAKTIDPNLPTIEIRSNVRALTRKAFFEEAFSYLNEPYGWGGYNKGRDCSRFLMTVFDSFNLKLPRNSFSQSQVGSFHVDVGNLDDPTKIQIIEQAHNQGIALLYLPGHIMLYLGKDESQRPMALHSFAEYLETCPSSKTSTSTSNNAANAGPQTENETLVEVHKLTVSDLELGRGTSRKALIERVTRVVVFGKPPYLALQGIATERLPSSPQWTSGEKCKDSQANAIFISPAKPVAGEQTRIILTSEHKPGPLALSIFKSGEQGEPIALQTLGGPPYSFLAEKIFEKPGDYVAVFGDGPTTIACQKFKVRQFPPRSKFLDRQNLTFWNSKWKWEQDTENFYSAFVEQLFKNPSEEDVTWPHLQTLIGDEKKNLLFNHFGLNEDVDLNMGPDCADLPYYLRAYFAWKLKLPFGYRKCSRGKAGRPPRCGEFFHNQMPIEEKKASSIQNEAQAFKYFLFKVRNTVHSASARTVPDDSMTDLYPVELTREALRPGIVFADPYGHLLVIASWKPQTLDSYGVLVGADAQPDKTVGRRRFWRGSFLFSPSTKDVGAGFKAWRPIFFDHKTQEFTNLENLKLKSAHFKFSTTQYQGDKEQFYDQMLNIINPRPLDPKALLLSLIDALEESVLRRINSVNNGEQFIHEHTGKIIEMPVGTSIFQTTGDWENYSTPSRDMRLLISMDAVLNFPQKLVSASEQFGFSNLETAREEKEKLTETLEEELSKRVVQYSRSDGSLFSLSLKELRNRKEKFEMAYNPNDCAEIRWGASEDSEEFRTCHRQAPENQRTKMKQYRPWFKNRERPIRQ